MQILEAVNLYFHSMESGSKLQHVLFVLLNIRLTFIFLCLKSFTKNAIDYIFGKVIPRSKLLINFSSCENLFLEQVLKARVTKLLIHAPLL